MSVKHFLAESEDTHDQVLVLAPEQTLKLDELERDLRTVRHHYHELGQRASALASERDAVAARLNAARAEAQAAREQLEALQARIGAPAAELEARLETQQAELAEERRQRQALEARLAQEDSQTATLLEQQEQQLRARESELVRQLDSLTEQLAASEQQRSRLETQLQALAEQLAQARQHLEAERDAAGERVGILEQRIAELQAQSDSAQQQARELQAALSSAAEQQRDSEARLAVLEQERPGLLSELEKAQQAASTQRDTAQHQIAALETRLGELETLHGEALDVNRQLEAARAETEQKRQQAEAQVAALQQERETLTAQIKDAQRAAASQRDSDRAQIAELEQRIAELETEYATSLQQASERESALSTSAQEAQQRAAEFEQTLQQERKALVSQLDEAQRAASTRQEKHRAQLADLEQRLSAFKTERDTARQQIADLETRIGELEARHDEALDHTRQLESARAEAETRQQQTAEQLVALEQRLQQERETLATQLEGAQRTAATQQDKDRAQIAELEQRIAELATEHSASVQRALELESALSTSAQEAQQRAAEFAQTLQQERQALASQLEQAQAAAARQRDSDHALIGELERRIAEIEARHDEALQLTRALEAARAEAEEDRQQALAEQSRLNDALGTVEQRLAENERLGEAAREEAARRDTEAQKVQQTLGDKVRQLAEQLHQQHQQHDRLQQQVRERKTRQDALRAEFEREAAVLRAEVARLQGELERQRSAAIPGEQQSAEAPASPPEDTSAGPNSWKMVAGASLLLGTVASATAYWSSPRDSVAGTTPGSPPGSGFENALPVTAAVDIPITLAATDDRAAQPAGAQTSGHEPGGAAEIAGDVSPAFAARGSSGTDHEPATTLQNTARASLRELGEPLVADTLDFSGDPLIREQQHNLMALGFDLGEARADGFKGKLTRQALLEFQLYYLPVTGQQAVSDDEQLASLVKIFADIARNDQQAFGIDSEVLAAIRLGSLRTGMDFPYLMELAFTESTFDPYKKARRSSASGLYQFTDSTWLECIRAYGAKYGLGLYAERVEYVTDAGGRRHPTVHNPIVREHVLALRYDPRIATLMAAEFTLQNRARLARQLGHEPGRTALYLAHFFGVEDALEFLRRHKEQPQAIAAQVFPKAALANPGVFSDEDASQRTLQDVYAYFEAKFGTGQYETLNPALVLVENSEP